MVQLAYSIPFEVFPTIGYFEHPIEAIGSTVETSAFTEVISDDNDSNKTKKKILEEEDKDTMEVTVEVEVETDNPPRLRGKLDIISLIGE